MFAFLLAAQQTESIILARFAWVPLAVLCCESGNKCISFRFSKNEKLCTPAAEIQPYHKSLPCPITKNQAVQV